MVTRFIQPAYTRVQVRAAGERLKEAAHGSGARACVMPVIVNWRAAHAYPMNTFQATLRKRLKRLGPFVSSAAIVASRLKRLPSIEAKLLRNESMKLERMQDIAGIRAVVGDMRALHLLSQKYLEGAGSHLLRGHKDYLENPKDDGYRSVHFVFEYNSGDAAQYNGLRVELQIRTRLQHTWATGVEIVDTFAQQAIKAGAASPQWTRFFKLVSVAFAHQEGTAIHAEFADSALEDIRREIGELERELDILARLDQFRLATRVIHRGGNTRSGYHLVVLDLESRTLSTQHFSEKDAERASDAYAKAERRAALGEKIDPVLVAAGKVGLLRKAYPNYFLDAENFMREISVLSGKPLPPSMASDKAPEKAPRSRLSHVLASSRRKASGAGGAGLEYLPMLTRIHVDAASLSLGASASNVSATASNARPSGSRSPQEWHEHIEVMFGAERASKYMGHSLFYQPDATYFGLGEFGGSKGVGPLVREETFWRRTYASVLQHPVNLETLSADHTPAWSESRPFGRRYRRALRGGG